MKACFKIILCFALTLSFAPEASAKGGSCTAKIVGKCKSEGGAIMDTGDISAGPGGRDDVHRVSGITGDRSRRMGAAGERCAASASECDKCPPAEREQCKKEVGDAAGDMKAQSAGMGDAGAMMGAIAGLAAAMLPMLMKKDEEEEQQKQDPNSALQCGQNGCTIDCSKNDAYNYPQCDTQLAASCMNAMSDWRCVNFANRYCNGTGVGSAYCNRAVAYQFCSPGGRDMCPSCLQLQKETSAGCIQNPAACLGQNSPEETEKMRATCPNDPVFVGAGQAGFGGVAGGLPAPTPLPGGGVPPANPNLPPPILPAGTNGGTGGTGGTAGGTNGGGTGTIVTSSVAGGRDAYQDKMTGGKLTAQSATGGGGGYGAQSTGGDPMGGGGGRDTAGTGGFKPASTSSGPTSDVNGRFGPSLFHTASQVIRNRCAEARFHHCP